jgi:hypothetical protein
MMDAIVDGGVPDASFCANGVSMRLLRSYV